MNGLHHILQIEGKERVVQKSPVTRDRVYSNGGQAQR